MDGWMDCYLVKMISSRFFYRGILQDIQVDFSFHLKIHVDEFQASAILSRPWKMDGCMGNGWMRSLLTLE